MRSNEGMHGFSIAHLGGKRKEPFVKLTRGQFEWRPLRSRSADSNPSGGDVCFAGLNLGFELIGHFKAIFDQVLQPISQLLLPPRA